MVSVDEENEFDGHAVGNFEYVAGETEGNAVTLYCIVGEQTYAFVYCYIENTSLNDLIKCNQLYVVHMVN